MGTASQNYIDALTRIEEAKSQTQGAAIRENANLWGQTIGNIGQYISQIPQQQAQLKEIQNRAALTDLEKQREQRLAATEQRNLQGQQEIATAVANFPRNDDDTVNIPLLQRTLMANPNANPDYVDKVLSSIERSNDFTTKYNQTQRDKVAEWSNNVLMDHPDPKEPITWDAVHFKAALAPKGFIGPADQQQLATAEQQGADPRQVLESLKRLGSQYRKEGEPIKLGKDEVLTQLIGGKYQTVASNPVSLEPKTKEELAVAIEQTNPADPKYAGYVRAWQRLVEAEPKISSAAEDERYRKIIATAPPMRTPEDKAWAAAYERQKTLGVDTSAAAASARLAKSEEFQISEKGRDRLDKVNQAYHTAQSGVDTLRETIDAAQRGNVTAASMQSLLTTMATLKAEGFNRINTAEIGSTKDAGSLVQNIEGWFGKAKEGQPIPASVQQDMKDYATILEKAAANKYIKDFNSVKQTYGLRNAVPEVTPTATPPAPGKNPFR